MTLLAQHAHHHHAHASDGDAYLLVAIYSALIVGGSLFGGWLPSRVRLTHKRLQITMSFVGGLMLGIGVLHLLPHALGEVRDTDLVAGWVMGGLVSMFLLLRMFHFHQHGVAEVDGDASGHGHAHGHGRPHELSWMGVALGLGLHTLIDGIALAASVEADRAHGLSGLLGVGTFLAVLLHKPLDAASITSLMGAGGWSPRARQLVNAGFALMCPVGALLFFLGLHQFSDAQHTVVGCALAFSAGVFLCISLGDILPELEFHAHDRLRLTLVLLLGIAAAWGIGFLEPDHLHAH